MNKNKFMRIASWNIAALPKLINPHGNPFKRLQHILDKLITLDAEIICLQEVFDYKIIQQITEFMEQKGYHIQFSTCKKHLLPKNGLMTFSLFPILEREETDFSTSFGVESFINKGILTTKIDIPMFGDFYVHNTHTQSDIDYCMKKYSRKYRMKQFSLIRDQLVKYEDCHAFQILVGDLNDDFDVTTSIFDFYKINPESLNTYPKNKKQLDYIMFNDQILDLTYRVLDCKWDKTSNHNILLCDIHGFNL